MGEDNNNGGVESDSLLMGTRGNSYNGTGSGAASTIINGEDSASGISDNSTSTSTGTSSDISYGGDDHGDGNSDGDGDSATKKSATASSSIFQASINMTKMCIGTGVLALPYATNEGGLLWYVVGLSIVTAWNIYSTDLLLKCHHLMNEFNQHKQNSRHRNGNANATSNEEGDFILSPLRSASSSSRSSKRVSYRSTSGEKTINFDEHFDVQSFDEDIDGSSNNNTGTFGRVALFAFGKPGLHFIDTLMMILMFGIIISYEDAILGFVSNTPISSGNKNVDALFMLLIITPLASLSDFSVISKVSALGTSIIVLIFIMIGWYGVQENGFTGFTVLHDQPLYPKDFYGFSAWYGCVAFGFGTVPFTFNLQETMKNPNDMMKATKLSLWAVFSIYILMGGLISIIFWPSLHGIESDLISALPQNGSLSNIIKLSMTMVILSTTPLIIVPCGDLVQRKLGLNNRESLLLGKINIAITIRISVCMLCGFISVLVPNFVYVISFFGCLCVSMLVYIYPSLAHISCLLKLRSKRSITSSELQELYIDCILLPIGIISCFFTSCLTFQTMMGEMKKSSSL